MKRTYLFLLGLGILFVVTSPLLASSVTPDVILNSEKKNPDCQYICAGCYSQLKDDFPPHPAGAEHTISDSQLTVTITCITSNDNDEMMSFDWSANIPVSAVIVKTKDASVYLYDPAVTSDSDLIPPGQNAVSHITFCYTPPQLEVAVSGLKNLTIDQPSIGQWAATGDFKPLIGDPNDGNGTGLTVTVTATVPYYIYISYSYSINPTGSLPSPEEPLSYEYPSGTWYAIPKQGTWAPLYGLSGTATHSYPVAVDLTQLGDRTANDSITFTIHVMVTQ